MDSPAPQPEWPRAFTQERAQVLALDGKSGHLRYLPDKQGNDQMEAGSDLARPRRRRHAAVPDARLWPVRQGCRRRMGGAITSPTPPGQATTTRGSARRLCGT